MTIEGLLGRKLGMVGVFDDQGRLHGATAIEVGPCTVTQVKADDTDGYTAVQIGFGEAKRVNKPTAGHLARSGAPRLRHLAEFRTDGSTAYEPGQTIGVELFEAGDVVDVSAVSKGRGFQGGVKRHHFAGGPKTHGQSDRHRSPGSVGAGTSPGRVFKGTKMAGHMGSERITTRNLKIVAINAERHVVFVAGSVPGPKGALVHVRRARQVKR